MTMMSTMPASTDYCLAGDHVVDASWMRWINDQWACTKCIARARTEARHYESENVYAMCMCRHCVDGRREIARQRHRDRKRNSATTPPP